MPLGNSSAVLPAAAQTPLGAEVLKGLTAQPKTLSPWLFYDQRGSRLFEQITDLPEYYLTRTERSIFAEHAPEMLAAAAGDSHLTLIELGAGTASKTGLLLRAALAQQPQLTYRAIDVSGSALNAARESLAEKFPTLSIETRVGDYTDGLGHLPCEASANARMVPKWAASVAAPRAPT